MKTITLCLFISAFSLFSNGSFDVSIRSALPLCVFTLEVIWAASAPSILSTGDPFLNKITVGTESTYFYKRNVSLLQTYLKIIKLFEFM